MGNTTQARAASVTRPHHKEHITMAAAANTSSLRERITFDANTTQTVTLDGIGAEQAGRDGPEYRYFLRDHKIMWVPPEVHAEIERANGNTGSTFDITKKKHGRNPATWEVVEVVDEPPSAGYGQASPTRQANPQPAARPAPTPVKPAANANTSTRQQQLPQTTGEPWSASLYSCLCAAVNVAAEAEKFAQSIGRPLAFETPDIRAMAASLFIHANGGK